MTLRKRDSEACQDYWPYDALLPELLHLKLRSEKRRAVREACWNWQYCVLIGTGVLVAVGIALITRQMVLEFLKHYLFVPNWLTRIMYFPSLGLIVGFGAFCSARFYIQKKLRRVLAAWGVPICSICGYDIRTTQENRCPECGMPIALTTRCNDV